MRVRGGLCCGVHDSGTPFESFFVFGFLSTFVRFVACEESYLCLLVRVWSLWKQTEKDADGELVLSGVSEIDIFISSMFSSGSAFWTTTRGSCDRPSSSQLLMTSAFTPTCGTYFYRAVGPAVQDRCARSNMRNKAGPLPPSIRFGVVRRSLRSPCDRLGLRSDCVVWLWPRRESTGIRPPSTTRSTFLIPQVRRVVVTELLMLSNNGITRAIDVVIGGRHVPGCGDGSASNKMEGKRFSSVPPRRA